MKNISFLLLLCAALTMAACQGSTTSSDSGSTQDPIVGTWVSEGTKCRTDSLCSTLSDSPHSSYVLTEMAHTWLYSAIQLALKALYAGLTRLQLAGPRVQMQTSETLGSIKVRLQLLRQLGFMKSAATRCDMKLRRQSLLSKVLRRLLPPLASEVHRAGHLGKLMFSATCVNKPFAFA